MNTNALFAATALALLVGCGQQSRYEVTTKDGVTIKIDNATGKTYRLNGNSWVEIKDAGGPSSEEELVRSTYEKLSTERLEAELERLKAEEPEDAFARAFGEEGKRIDFAIKTINAILYRRKMENINK